VRKLNKLKTRYKIAVAAGVTATMIGGAGLAYAFFASTGSATTSGNVAGAQSGTWGIAFGTPTYSAGAAIYPGTNETVLATITNSGNGYQGLTGVSVALKTSGSDVATAAGADIPGCLSSWWSAAVTDNNNGASGSNWSAANPDNLATGGTDTEKVTLTLNNQATINQSACQSAAPGFTVSAS